MSPRETEEVIKSFKNGKSPEPVDTPAELIKAGIETLYEHVRKLIQNCLDGIDYHLNGTYPQFI